MALPLPFGNYLALDTPIHRIDARVKLLLVAVYVFALFACKTWIGLSAALLLLVILFAVAHIPARRALRGLKPVLFILAFTLLANALTFGALDPATPTEQAAAQAAAAGTASAEMARESHAAQQATLLSLPWLGLDLSLDLPQSIPLMGSFGIRPLGIVRGLYFALRISLLVLVTSLLTYTTSVVSLTDAIGKLLAPLRALRVPVEDIAMVFTIALRFIPLTASEAEKLIVAQSARGARFNQGGLIRRARAWIPVMIPLFVNLFRRADHLAQAMESRCYIGRGRTQLSHDHLTGSDFAWAVCGSALLVAIGLLL
ncbi:MAG: energy-coupling factor transporter transmembrane protein EcfT [Coriobacteriales bacterium]|jgi:energy-coupling factor transport system permease protein|nr:energy-coupling factor transporter transmembrane protein EcfT [Coriobacteriales bacterium]